MTALVLIPDFEVASLDIYASEEGGYKSCCGYIFCYTTLNKKLVDVSHTKRLTNDDALLIPI